ncbi:hypothetical protein [Dialister succinatiphilus]|uniref:hypothetical protein n=1 Tax=Dialister succinatiphilus TaxID=487173 RepID=UPI003AB227F0
MEFIYTLYNYLRSNLGTVLFVCLYVTLAIYPIKRFIREKNYPFGYRFFDYTGSFLFFVSPVLVVNTDFLGNIPPSLLTGLFLFIWGIGILCIGISLLLLPSKSVKNSVILKKKKGKWKLCIACGFYVLLLAIGFILNGYDVLI